MFGFSDSTQFSFICHTIKTSSIPPFQAYATIDGVAVDVLIDGAQAQNRAVSPLNL